MKVLGLEFAPLNIPLERRLQTLAVIHYVMIFLFIPMLCAAGTLLVLFSQHWWLVALYGIWFLYDFDAPSRGGRPSHWFRNSACWRYFRDYFPISLHKTTDLNPNKNYIFGYHPHGIMCIGAFTNFATHATNFEKLFPGACDVSKKSIQYLLRRREKGEAVVIVIGGAAEALDAKPGGYNILLSRRMGFVKIAIQEGAELVPVFSFGENDLYRQMDNPVGSRVRAFQDWFKNHAGFSPPFFRGRGVFNYTWGMLPYRHPIDTVVGKPIDVLKNPNPSKEEVQKVHEKYTEGLIQLFEENKQRFGIESDVHLSIH